MISKNENATAIFWASYHEAQKTCSFPTVFNYEAELPSGLTIHTIFKIATGVAAAINISIALYLLQGHLRHWTKPLIQQQGCRVIVFLIWLSVTTLLSAIFYNHSQYIVPVGELYEGFAIAAVFLLYVRIIASNLPSYEAFFQDLEARKSGSTAWFKRLSMFVFQIIPVRIICLIAFEVLFGATCPLAKDRARGRTTIQVISSISTALAVTSIVIFEKRLKTHLRPFRSLGKLWAFKIVVILNLLQSLVFVALAQKDIWQPSAPYYMSYNDFMRGIPQVMLIWELTIAALVFLWAYTFNRYRREMLSGTPVAVGPAAALVEVFSLGDMLNGMKYAFGGSQEALVKAIGAFSGRMASEASAEDLKH